MNNNFFSKFKSSFKINIKGKNINRFINRLIHNNIEILSLNKISNDEINIVVNKKDYKKINNLKSIYKLEIIDYYGYISLKKLLYKNSILISFLLIGFIFIYFLSNIIFEVKVIYDKKEIQDLLINELKKYNIKPYKFVKNFNEVEKIKEKILNDCKDKLEWIEIERSGVKYIVRVEERKNPKTNNEIENRNIVAKKSAIIKDIFSTNGVVLKMRNDYVKKGEVIVTGDIYLNEKYINSIAATGSVYGEVWYKSKVEIPFIYNELNYTSKFNKVFVLSIFNKKIELFNFNKFEKKQSEEKILLFHPLLPIKFSLEKQRKIEALDKIYTVDEAVEIGVKKSIEAIKNKLKEKEHIISSKKLKVEVKESKIVLEMFFSIYEDITDYQKIAEKNLEE